MIEADLITALKNMDAVTAIVGSGAVARIRTERFEADDDDALEAGTVTGLLLVEVDDETPQHDLTGRGALVFATATLTCRGRTKAEARRLSEAVKFNETSPGTGIAGYDNGVMMCYLDSTDAAAVSRNPASNDQWHDVLLTINIQTVEQT